jgi:hypothetical protein
MTLIWGKNYKADLFQAYYSINPNNQIEVSERLYFHFEKGTFSWVERSLSSKYIDKLKVLSADIDSVNVPAGIGTQRIQITDNQVKWTFHKIKNTRKHFGLNYLVEGVIFQENDEDIFQYTLLPAKHLYEIDSLDIRIDFSQFKGNLTAHQLLSGKAIVSLNDSMVWVRNKEKLKKNETVQLQLRFHKGTLISENPKWYQLKQKARRLLLVYGLISLLLLGIATYYAFAVYRKYNVRFKPNPRDLNRLTEGPDNQTAIESAYLLSQSIPEYHYLHYITATLLDMLKNNKLTCTLQNDKKHSYFELNGIESNIPLNDYEKMMFDAVFHKQKNGFSCELKKAINHANLKSDRLVKQIRNNLIQEDLISSFLAKQRKKITLTGSIISIVGVISILPLVLFFDILSISALLLVFALIVCGIIVIIGGQSISPLTPQGIQLSQYIYYHKRHIEDLLEKDYSAEIHEYMLSQIPYLFAYNLQSRWFMKIKKGENDIPEWLKISETCSRENTRNCFNALMTTFLVYSESSTSARNDGHSVHSGIAGGGSSSAG